MTGNGKNSAEQCAAQRYGSLERCTASRSISKGQSVLLSHAIMVGISVLLVFVIATTMNQLRSDYEDFIGEASADQLCLLLKAGTDRAFRSIEYNSSSNTTYGRVFINFPDRVGGKAYRISLVSENRSISVSGFGAFNTTCIAGHNASYSGFTTGGRTRVEFRHFTNGTKLIEVSRV